MDRFLRDQPLELQFVLGSSRLYNNTHRLLERLPNIIIESNHVEPLVSLNEYNS